MVTEQQLYFIVAPAATDERLEWSLGYDAYNRKCGPGRGKSRSHGWLAARTDEVEEISYRINERYDSEQYRFGW